MRLVPFVSGRVIWPQGSHAHRMYQRWAGFASCVPCLLGLLSAPYPFVCLHRGPWHSPGLLPLPSGSTPTLSITHSHGWPPPGLHTFLLFLLLIKETSAKMHSFLQQTFKIPIFWTFQICLEESQRQSLFSFCSYYALQGPFIGMETTAFLYTLGVPHPMIWLCKAHSALHIMKALEYFPGGTLSCPVSTSVNLSCLLAAHQHHLFPELSQFACKSTGSSHNISFCIIVSSCSLKISIILHLT